MEDLFLAAVLPASWVVHFYMFPTNRVEKFGFRFLGWRQAPNRIFTHMFTHATEQHLASNVVSYVALVMGAHFMHQRRGMKPYRALEGIRRRLLLFGVMLIGGSVGGLGLTWILEAHVFGASTATSVSSSGVLSFMAGKVFEFVHEKRTEMTYVCGASAAICALAGWDCAVEGNTASHAAMLLPSAAALFNEHFSHRSSQSSGWVGILKEAFSTHEGLRVGHAAHIGGFVVGALVGLLFRHIKM